MRFCLILFCLFLLACKGRQLRQEYQNDIIREKILYENVKRYPKNYPFTHPENYSFYEKEFTVELFAREFSPGELVYAELFPKTCHYPRIEVYGKEVPLSALKAGYRFFLGIPPDYEKDNLILKVKCGLSKNLEIPLKKKIWPISEISLDLGKHSDVESAKKEEIQNWIKESQEKKSRALSVRDPPYLNSVLFHPRNEHFITSSFWKKRKYERYYEKNGKKIFLEPTTSIHKGLDLRGQPGEPVFSMAQGRVVLADHLYYEGNFVLISHGEKIFTGYMHLNKIIVKEGDFIKAGEQIGTCGNTGMVTGPHLHVFLMVRGVMLDPLSLLHLPIR